MTAPILFRGLYGTPVVTEYLGRYPEVCASCFYLDRMVNMLEEGVDVAIRIPDSSMQVICVGQIRRVICASPSYQSTHGIPTFPDDLLEHAIVSSSTVTPSPEWKQMNKGVACRVRLQPRMVTSTNDSTVRAGASGFGLTRLLSYQVAEHLRNGKLKTVLADFEPPPLPIHVAYREGRRASQRVSSGRVTHR